MPDTRTEVIVGVDTHADTHTAFAIDHTGRKLGALVVAAEEAGYAELWEWGCGLGALGRAGVEGTGCYGAGLARFLAAKGVEVVEVNRPNRQRRRRHGKSDPTDAEAAARAVLAGEATAAPKTRDGIVESIRVLRVPRASALKARTQVANQIKDLVVAAPEDLRSELRPLKTHQRVARSARLEPGDPRDPAEATRVALRSLALRYQQLTDELRRLNRELARLTRIAAPRLLERPGVGVESAGKLLVAAGDNAHRLSTDAALAALCGASPVEASSGRVTRHRLNRGGNRQANNALWTIATNRLRHDTRTRDYAQRRTHEGKTRAEIIRCLKRYLARELHPLLLADLHDANTVNGTGHESP